MTRRQLSRIEIFTLIINRWSRRTRIRITIFQAVMFTALTAMINNRFPGVARADNLLPWLPTLLVGLATYIIGWYLFVGFDEPDHWRATRHAVLWLLAGLFSTALLILLILIGLAIGFIF